MIKIRPTVLKDFSDINIDASVAHFIRDTFNIDTIRAFIASRSIMTAEHDGRPLFIADSNNYRDGIYVWALADVQFRDRYRSIVARIKRWMCALDNIPVYAHVADGDDVGRRFIKFLGFDLAKVNHYETKGVKFHLYKRESRWHSFRQ